MRSLLITGLTVLVTSSSAIAQAPKTASEICKKEADYERCLRFTRLGDAERKAISPEYKPKEPNSCHEGYAYRGQGICQKVICVNEDGNDPQLGGKNHKCKSAPFWSGYIGRQVLRWGYERQQAFHDPNCPDVNPEIGWTSSCHEFGKNKNLSTY